MVSHLLLAVAVLLQWPATAGGTEEAPELDPNGYILYCPCMGRFGNQADHFLGSLSFAHGLNRTLVLPPWVEFVPGKVKSVQVPFDRYFKVEPLLAYHRVITMEIFMEHLAPSVWPSGQRTAFCYTKRHGSEEDTCNAKDGNPFGPFWDTFDVDFDASEFFGPLHFDTHNPSLRQQWQQKYPPSDHYVMAFTGAPASFPVQEQDVALHGYLEWSDHVARKAEGVVARGGIERPFLGVHLRHGSDWKNACDHVSDERRNLFASAQCLGYRMEHGTLNAEMCLPGKDTVVAQVKAKVKQTKVKAVFVAADDNPFLAEIQKAVGKKVKVVKQDERDPHVDLAVLGMADHAIVNCVSTFSAFAARERRAHGKPVDFWAFTPAEHDEL